MEYAVLAALAPEDRRHVLATTHRRRFAASEVIVREGDPGDTLHLIARGRVGVHVSTRSGSVALVNVHGAGEVFGEQALIGDATHRSATITALEPTETLSLDRAAFDRLRRAHPGVDRLLVEALSAEVRRLTHRLAEALYDPAEKRVLRRVLELDALFGGPVPLTQDNVASMAGTTRPTTNVVLRRLVAEGILDLRRGRFEVLDRAALEGRAR